ncbi:MAG: sugar transporter substrate-binding protein [Modestobacter sp.]|jgi:ABC-type sugar transport system substrate-binding protein|nr:sugar transporter substrate-binding protein [Modestobacter sp.]
MLGRLKIGVTSVALLAMAACSSAQPSSSGGEASSQPTGKVHIAFLMGAGSTSGNSANLRGAKAAAAKLGVELSVLDATFSPQKQYAQFQSAIASKKYQGIVIDGALDGPAIASLVPSAQAAGIKVGDANLPIGTDYVSSDIQTKGVDVQVLVPFGHHGTIAGELTVQACKGIDPCGVGYMFIKKGSAYDAAVRESYDAAIKSSPNVHILGEASSNSSAQGGAAAAQTMVTGNKDIRVLVGPELALLAAIPVVDQAQVGHGVQLIAFGGSDQSAAAVKAGTFYGVSANATVDEGRLVIEKLHEVITKGGGPYAINTIEAAGIPDNGRITKENVDQWKLNG